MSTQIQTPTNRKVFVDLDGFDRIRSNSPERLNQKVEHGIQECVRAYVDKDKESLTRHIRELDREWDIDRGVMAFFASLVPVVMFLGLKRNKRFFAFGAVQAAFLAYHAAKGWCPPASLLRRLGFRSQKEIDAEKYALKTIRGDFALH